MLTLFERLLRNPNGINRTQPRTLIFCSSSSSSSSVFFSRIQLHWFSKGSKVRYKKKIPRTRICILSRRWASLCCLYAACDISREMAGEVPLSLFGASSNERRCTGVKAHPCNKNLSKAHRHSLNINTLSRTFRSKFAYATEETREENFEVGVAEGKKKKEKRDNEKKKN